MRNPKQEDTNLWDCKSQKGLCPKKCNQCYYNQLGEEHDLVRNTIFPTLDDIGEDGIVRVNTFHDSNINRRQVIADSAKYKKKFFNTSIYSFDKFEEPIVYTANSSEETSINLDFLQSAFLYKLMFIRLRVSVTNIEHVIQATDNILTFSDVPVVWTLMKYYDTVAMMKGSNDNVPINYVLKKVLLHERWTPSIVFKEKVQLIINKFKCRRVHLCGTLFSELCKDCRNCETYYYQTRKRMDIFNL